MLIGYNKHLYSIDGGEHLVQKQDSTYNHRYTTKHIMVLNGEEIDVYSHGGFIVEKEHNYYFNVGSRIALHLKGEMIMDKIPMYTSETIGRRSLKIQKLIERINQK